MATGDTLAVFTASHNEPPGADFAAFDVRNDHLVLDFDDSSDESAVFSGVLPRQYKGSGLTVNVIWAATTATSGDVVWAAAFERLQEDADDLDSASFAAAQTATAIAASDAGKVKRSGIEFTHAQIDGLLIGERFRVKVTRDADHASDTMTGDAELIAVGIRET